MNTINTARTVDARITENTMTLIESKEMESDGPKIPLLIRGIAIVMSIYQLFTGLFQLTAMNQRVTHVTFALVLIYLYYSFGQKKKERITWDGYFLAGVTPDTGYICFVHLV